MSVQRIVVPVQPRAYEVVIGSGLLRGAGELIKRATGASRVALITDSEVAERYGSALDIELSRAGLRTFGFTVPAGEVSKSWATAGALLEGLAEVGLGRDDAVVALGGGVVGDLAGFAAAVYLRGIEYVQVPTTLLAMVDASVGGKTAVDLDAGKNLAGAFKQPALVLMDTDTLQTLPEREWLSGLAEVAKSAVIDGEEFLSWVERNAAELGVRDSLVTAEAIKRCVEFKSGVVAGDEREEGPRECLNYGHTFGHAIEKASGYGVVPHGMAVAEGMRFAIRLSEDVAGASSGLVARQDALLDALGLSTLEAQLGVADLFRAMQSDKKARAGTVRFVLVDEPGRWSCGPVDDSVILGYLEAWADARDSANADPSKEE